jgi:DNA-binding response OmpR family regulator
MKHLVLVSSCDPYVAETLHVDAPDIEIVVDASERGIADKMQELPDIALFILDMEAPVQNVAGLLRYASRVRQIPTLFLYDERLQGKITGAKWLPKPLTRSALLPHLPDPNRLSSAGDRFVLPSEQNVLQSGPLTLNRKSYRLLIDDDEIHLPMKEFLLLAYLFEHRNQVLTREQLHRAVWKRDGFFDPNALTVYIKNIRHKLGPYKACIRTVWGVGYQFVGHEE